MIRLYGPINTITAVAVSGGVDSMAALSFLHNSNPKVAIVHFNHGTEHGGLAQEFVEAVSEDWKLPLILGRIKGSKPQDESWEEYWRKQRYAFLHSLEHHTIATAHHLDDVAETYLWGCIHGQPRFIHYRQPGEGGPTNIVRPFLQASKNELLAWCERRNISWIYDPSNEDITYSRNRIRHEVMPQILKVNPGFLSVVQRLWLAEETSRPHA